MAPPGDDDGEEAREWRYSLEDLEDGEAGDEEGRDEEAGDEEGGDGTGVAGTFAPSRTIEPGEIDPENALFVLVGVLVATGIAVSYVLVLL